MSVWRDDIDETHAMCLVGLDHTTGGDAGRVG